MKKKVKIDVHEVPRETDEIAFKRVECYLDKYTDELRRWNSTPFYKGTKMYNLKDLMFSCYTQGLSDATQVLERQMVDLL